VEEIAGCEVLGGAMRVVGDVALREVEKEADLAVDAGRDEDLDVEPLDGRGVALVGREDPEPDGERDGTGWV